MSALREVTLAELTAAQPVSGMCRPPLPFKKVLAGLTAAEREDVLRTMIIWAPDVFERAVKFISEDRAAGIGG